MLEHHWKHICFFGRIMKEHALFLQAGFPAGETGYRNKANWYREEFEKALWQTVRLSDGMVGKDVLRSGEVFTEFTVMAEQQTGRLTKIPIDFRITQAEERLRAGCAKCADERMAWRIGQLNQHVLHLLSGLIMFKKQILREVTSCRLYTANYPLLIEHIIREAELYQHIITSLEERTCMSSENMVETELFWNQIMMEHALFIRGLLDPTECELVETADTFAGDYCRLLEEARQQDCRAMNGLTRRTLETTKRYRDFKAAGTKGITGCDIRSIILTLLADHVLREAQPDATVIEEGLSISRNSVEDAQSEVIDWVDALNL
ncbi:DUF2935 domain-containing protein [Sellimonas caecigallum]|uniref:DUF2935 domain-containing protein n=2 Tax=Sellimonas caecigallum TaxID=2592333 RepID=A0ABS7L8V5_9FIRM|nr:DUF2935 domain-containing protein [Sellimonas caecigallum]